MSRFTEPRLPSTDTTSLPDITPAIALTAAGVVLYAPLAAACVIGGLTYGLLQSNKAG